MLWPPLAQERVERRPASRASPSSFSDGTVAVDMNPMMNAFEGDGTTTCEEPRFRSASRVAATMEEFVPSFVTLVPREQHQ